MAEIIKLDGIELPGILNKITAGTSVLYIEKETKGTSGKTKELTGWEDNNITLDYTIIDLYNTEGKLTNDKNDILIELNSIFKKVTKGFPTIFKIENKFLNALNIKNVLFESLDITFESKGAFGISIKLKEDKPKINKSQNQDKTKTKTTVTTTDNKKKAGLDDKQSKQYNDYLKSQQNNQNNSGVKK